MDQEPVAPALDSASNDDGSAGPLEFAAVIAMFVLLTGVLLWDWTR